MQLFQREHVNPYTDEKKLIPTIAAVEERRSFYTGGLFMTTLEIPVDTMAELLNMERRLGANEFEAQILLARSLPKGTLRAYRAVKAQLVMEVALLRPAGFEPDRGVDGVIAALHSLTSPSSRSELSSTT